MRDTLFAEDVVILDHLKSRQSQLWRSHRAAICMWAFPIPRIWGLWSKPGAGFVCIEPWRGVADPVDFQGSLNDKPGIFRVAPGASQSLRMRIEQQGA